MRRQTFAVRAVLLLLTVITLPAWGKGGSGGPAVPLESDRTFEYRGHPVRLVRIAYGIPHVYAEDVGALFFGAGYAAAEDRLWQAEVYRRSAAGTLAEVGLGSPASDLQIRIHGYTDAEYDAMFASMPGDVRALFTGYVAGINRYLEEAKADPLHKLPLELVLFGIQPEPWTVNDVLRAGVFFTRRFGETGGADLGNLSLLQGLVATHGPERGQAMFDDLRWTDDPDSYASSPGVSWGHGRPRPGHGWHRMPEVAKAASEVEAREEAWRSDLAALGVPTKGGSNAWLIAPWRSETGEALLHGGPQMGYSIPQITFEIGIHGAGYDSQGMTFAGVAPYPLIGRGRSHAWTTTTGTTDTRDHVIEVLNPANPLQYLHRGRWLDMDQRVETVRVLGQKDPVRLTVLRTVHGPVVSHDPASGTAVALQRAHWMQELSSILGFAGFNRARNIHQFEDAVATVATSHHFFYIDQRGNIGYWLSGKVPIRPEGTDSRLPRLGTGEEEWLGFRNSAHHTATVNPRQGYVVNWNNKAIAGWDNGDSGTSYGPTHRVNVLEDVVRAKGRISWEEMVDINREAGTTHVDARAFRPLLLRAVAVVRARQGALPPAVEEAVAHLAAWDDRFLDGDGDGFYDAPGMMLFEAWFSRVRQRLFTPLLGNDGGAGGQAVLWRLMMHGGAALPLEHDWLGGGDVDALAVEVLGEVVAALGAQGTPGDRWLTPVRVQAYAVQGALPSVQHPYMNRGTYNQLVAFGRTGGRSVNVNPPGQNGLLPVSRVPGPHTHDQLGLYASWEYKPQVLDPLHR